MGSARRMPQMKTYQVIGRAQPTEAVPEPKLYKMKLFAPNEVVAKSRYWYFLSQIVKAKKATGEVVSIKEIYEKNSSTIKNYGIWLRYDSRSGTLPSTAPSTSCTPTWPVATVPASALST